MKLAEALILRADNQKRIEQLKQRMIRSAKVQEGDKPSEDPQALIEEFERLTSDLASLIKRINKTNAVTNVESGVTLSDALASRDVLRLKHGTYSTLAEAAAVTQRRSTRSEVKFLSTVNIVQIEAQADALAKEHRDLDSKIQSINWQTEVLE